MGKWVVNRLYLTHVLAGLIRNVRIWIASDLLKRSGVLFWDSNLGNPTQLFWILGFNWVLSLFSTDPRGV